MKLQFIVGILVLGLLFSGCLKLCGSNMFTTDGKCCSYVCNKECPNGYVGGTCNCVCVGEASDELPNTPDMNINDIFDDSSDIDPPMLPG